MIAYDFDEPLQKLFFNLFSDIPTIDWKKWVDISSREDYKNLAIKNSGLNEVEDLHSKIKSEKTNSRENSVDLESFILHNKGKEPLIFCHTSGSTNSSLEGLKWFHLSKPLIQRLWASGMRAIFESSGLNSNNSAVIFVPSRMQIDGLKNVEDHEYISLYSSEFSQRIMLSIIKPKSYLFYEYKESKNLEVITQILDMEDISVISAPATTILGWADINKLKGGIESYLKLIKKPSSKKLEKILLEIKSKGLDYVVKEIRAKLSEKLSKATLIFSTSSLSKSQWDLIIDFMKWKRGNEKFTNLYVGSEIGPFASSINFEIARSNQMYVFPLTYPSILVKGKIELLSETTAKFGNLLISRYDNEKPLINIDTGDIIFIDNNDGLPLIKGKILRNRFELKYPLKLSANIKVPSSYGIYAGHYFYFNEFEIIDPNILLECLNIQCELKADSLLLIKSQENVIHWHFILPSSLERKCGSNRDIYELLLDCPIENGFKNAIKDNIIEIKIIDEIPVGFISSREKILTKVRKGSIPKGILKKWPLYVVIPKGP